MKTFTGISLLAYFAGIVVTTSLGAIFDAATHADWGFVDITQPRPGFWSRFAFFGPGDLEGLGLMLLITLPFYGLLFRYASGETFRSRIAAFFAGLGTSLIGCSLSVYVLLDASLAVLGPRPFWVHIVNLPGGFIWFPISVTTITFFLILLIGKRLVRRAIS